MILDDFPDSEKYIQQITIENKSAKSMTFVLEMWGEIFEMPPGAIFKIVGEGFVDENVPKENFDIEVEENKIVVYGWAGAAVAVYSNGVELGSVKIRGRFPTTLFSSTKE